MKKAVSGIVLMLLLTSMLSSAFITQPVKAEWTGTVYIRADGSIDPADAPIITYDDVTYTLTDNITSSADGIVVERDNIVIDGDGYTLQGAGSGKGVDLSGRTNVTVWNTQIKNFDDGIKLYYSSNNNSICGNNITANNGFAILLYSSSNNTISGNNIANNDDGIWLDSSSNNNSICGNTFIKDGLVVWGSYHNSVENNTVNGKPLVYLEGVVDHTVGDAGQVILVNCTGIRAENLNLSSTDIGVQLWKTTDSVISGNNIANNDDGIWLYNSSNNSICGNNITANNGYGILLYYSSNNNSICGNNITANNDDGIRLSSSSNNNISGNNIANNDDGIRLYYSSNNSICGNNITANNDDGILLYSSSNNSICGNNIANNDDGILLSSSSNNTIYHNNFIDNAEQVSLEISYGNVWDDDYPSGGNYWSDYNGTDLHWGSGQNETGSDGIGDTAYVIGENNVDRYPLMAPFTAFNANIWNETEYFVDVVSNSTVSDFYFSPDEGAFLRFNVTGDDGTAGFCRVTIPKDLLWVEDGWTVSVGGEPVNYRIIPDQKFTYLYFTYNHSTKTVTIQGTNVIPEFPPTIVLPLFMMIALIAITLTKKKQKQKTK